jgi:hypothetical protein
VERFSTENQKSFFHITYFIFIKSNKQTHDLAVILILFTIATFVLVAVWSPTRQQGAKGIIKIKLCTHDSEKNFWNYVVRGCISKW